MNLYFFSHERSDNLSKQNARTLEVYEQTAKQFLANSIEHDNLDPAKAKRKRAKLRKFIKRSFVTLPKGAKVLEIGSADGENAKYLASLGFDVTASDVAKDILNELERQGLNYVKLDVIRDPLPDHYHGIFCWRVMVHFTDFDALIFLNKAYDALEPGGRLIFNAINREIKDVENEWVDFPGEYHMGASRFFNYYSEEDLRRIISMTAFRIVNFHLEGGDAGNSWLVFVLEK